MKRRVIHVWEECEKEESAHSGICAGHYYYMKSPHTHEIMDWQDGGELVAFEVDGYYYVRPVLLTETCLGAKP